MDLQDNKRSSERLDEDDPGGGEGEAESWGGKWIFLVCNEAASSASLWAEEWRDVLG